MARAFEAPFRIVDRRAFEKEESNPAWIENDREHGGTALRWSKADRKRLPSLINHLPRARISRSQFLQRRPCSCGDLRRIAADCGVEIRFVASQRHVQRFPTDASLLMVGTWRSLLQPTLSSFVTTDGFVRTREAAPPSTPQKKMGCLPNPGRRGGRRAAGGDGAGAGYAASSLRTWGVDVCRRRLSRWSRH